MPLFVRVALFPEATREHYDALAAELGDVGTPAGRVAFLAGPTTGGWQVVQVWRTQAKLDAFNAEVLLPALTRLGGRGFPRPPLVHDFLAQDADLPGEAGDHAGA